VPLDIHKYGQNSAKEKRIQANIVGQVPLRSKEEIYTKGGKGEVMGFLGRECQRQLSMLTQMMKTLVIKGKRVKLYYRKKGQSFEEL